MTKKLCLVAALALVFNAVGCTRLKARLEIREANELYRAEDYEGAMPHYERARKIDPSFPDLDRLIGYSSLGLYQPENKTPQNERYADKAALELQRYLQKRPNDIPAREALINLFLNANRTSQAIDFFLQSISRNPNDLESVKSVATLYAKQGNFDESLKWYERITQLDPKNPESFYIYGVVCWEKVAKSPPADMAQRLNILERGKAALEKAVVMKSDYFEAIVYANLIYREHAKLELDPVKQAALLAKADEYRNRAIAIGKARKAAAPAPNKAP